MAHKKQVQTHRSRSAALGIALLAFLMAGPSLAQMVVLPAEQLTPRDRDSDRIDAGFVGARPAWFSAPLDAPGFDQETAIGRGSAIGDTFSLAPVVQDNDSPANAFAMTSPTESTVTAGASASSNIGANFYSSTGGTFRVDTTVIIDTPTEGIHTVEVCAVAIDSVNAREPWVSAGQTGPGGETLFTWRLDVGQINASNTIDFPTNVTLIDSYTLAWDMSGALVFDGPQTLTTVDDQSISGVSLLQFQIDTVPVEIAGYDLAEVCLGWQVAEVIFADGFESGDVTAWAPVR